MKIRASFWNLSFPLYLNKELPALEYFALIALKSVIFAEVCFYPVLTLRQLVSFVVGTALIWKAAPVK